VTVAEKLRGLRLVEGHLRGLHREMTQKEVVGAIKSEMKRSISQPYLSQLESGQRKHLTNTSRLLLAKFFRVHPGYLVDDPEGYQTKLITNLRLKEDELDQWLVDGAERFRKDPGLSQVLLKLARRKDSRKYIRLLAPLLDRPELADQLWEILQPNEG
jgi:transcriptional regulator with XRE-family HTH domain